MNDRRFPIGPTGVGKPGQGLPETVKEHLRVIAESKAAVGKDLDAFVDFVDLGCSMYRASKGLQDEALPGRVRTELKAAHDAIHKLFDCVNQLGGVSRYLLYTKGGPDTRERFSESLSFIEDHLARARHCADQQSGKPGAPRGLAKVILAATVAHAIRTRMGVVPTTTRGGLFEEVLRTVLEATNGTENPDVHQLLSRALRAHVLEKPNGTLSIEPQDE